jgi:tRNA G37 N-methylase Trm5
MVDNAKLNKVTDKLKAYNMDGRDFVRQLVNGPEPVPFTQVIMNLPASAVEFLGTLVSHHIASLTSFCTLLLCH